jgi:hypothetical protein
VAIYVVEELSIFQPKVRRFLHRYMDRKTNGLPDGFPNGLSGVRTVKGSNSVYIWGAQ